MSKKTSRLVDTIIITNELHAEYRGYRLIGKEFVLKEPYPVKARAQMLDGSVVDDYFWVVATSEYVKRVPEAANEDNGEYILIPTFIAIKSFKPFYLT